MSSALHPRRVNGQRYPSRVNVMKKTLAPDPIAMEKQLDVIQPTQLDRAERSKVLTARRIKFPGPLADGNAIKMWNSKAVLEEIEDQIDEEFSEDFDLFLQGKSKWNNPLYSQVNGNFLTVPGVAPYLDKNVDAKWDYQKKIAKLCLGPWDNVGQVYMYYKYIVRRRTRKNGGIIELCPAHFLEDWNRYSCNAPVACGVNLGGDTPRS